MLVDSQEEYYTFLTNNKKSDLILECLPTNGRCHSANDSPCAILIRNINNNNNYVVSISHPDTTFKITKEVLSRDLSNFTGKKFTFDKKQTLHLLNIENLNDINLINFLIYGNLKDEDYETSAHQFYYRSYVDSNELNHCIPLVKHIESFNKKIDAYIQDIITFLPDESYNNLNKVVLENLHILESNGLAVNKDVFNSFFGYKNIKIENDLVYTEYNIFTSTGRPSNRFGGVNYAALKKDDGCRKSFISRHGDNGELFMVDYSAYHPHLIAKLINYHLPSDAYEYLGKFYFEKDKINEDELKEVKNITFQLIYGTILPEVKKIPFFSKINDYIEHRWKYFETYGYIETPIYKRQININNIKDPSPTKLFNYILQATETEYNMETLAILNLYLSNKLTKPVLYTYDAILFDVYKTESIEVIRNIKKIMTNNNFPIKCYSGNNYGEMIRISV